MSLVQMSLSGTVMILLIWMIRTVLIHKLPKTTFTALWMVVLLRLLIPVAIPSAFCIYSFFPNMDTIQITADDTPIAAVLSGIAELQDYRSDPAVECSGNLWLTLWIIGFAVCALYFAFAYCFFLQKYRNALPVRDCFVEEWLARNKRHRCVTVCQSCRINSPLSYGILHPIILFPDNTVWENRTQISFILEHEYAHICRYHSVVKMLLAACVCMHWFNPAVWWMFCLFNRDMEMVCDEAVIQKNGHCARMDYANVLIDIEETRDSQAVLSNFFRKSAIEQRVISIMKYSDNRCIHRVLTAVFVLGICICFATSAVHADVNRENDEWVWPAGNRTVTKYFGEQKHPVTGALVYSDHITILGEHGEKVVSAVSGTVTACGFDDLYGRYIVVTGYDEVQTLYGCLENADVRVGMKIAAGQQIGTLGNSGAAVGNCLLFAVIAEGVTIDPMAFYRD